MSGLMDGWVERQRQETNHIKKPAGRQTDRYVENYIKIVGW